jgi:hypothetical protein
LHSTVCKQWKPEKLGLGEKKTTLREEEVVMAEFVYKPTATAKAPETTRHQKISNCHSQPSQ